MYANYHEIKREIENLKVQHKQEIKQRDDQLERQAVELKKNKTDMEYQILKDKELDDLLKQINAVREKQTSTTCNYISVVKKELMDLQDTWIERRFGLFGKKKTRQVTHSIISNWINYVGEHLKEEPKNEDLNTYLSKFIKATKVSAKNKIGSTILRFMKNNQKYTNLEYMPFREEKLDNINMPKEDLNKMEKYLHQQCAL